MTHSFFKRFLIFFSLIFSTLSYSASFDCSKASSPFEKTICGNSTLSSLDDQLAAAYKIAKANSSNPDQLWAEEVAWIKNARTCGADAVCIQQSYKARIATLTSKPAGGSAQPVAPPTQQTSANPMFNDVGGFDKEYPQAPNDPKKRIRIELGQFNSVNAANQGMRGMSPEYVSLQSNQSGSTWRAISARYWETSEIKAAEADFKTILGNGFTSPRVVSYSVDVDKQISANINGRIARENAPPPPPQKIVLMDSKSNGSVAGSCWGVMWALSASNGYAKAIPMDVVMRARKLEPLFKAMYTKGGQDEVDKLNAYNNTATQSVDKHPQEYLDTFNFCNKAISK